MADMPGVAGLVALAATIDQVGAVEMHPEAARACARACDDYLAVLQEQLALTKRTTITQGFGLMESGRLLNEKFNEKLSGDGPHSMKSVLLRHAEVITGLRDAFVRVADTVEATEAHNAGRFGGLDGPR